MAARIEDYALIGDCETAALVSRYGSIDWLCVPRFDSGACFAALLGTPDHGRWRIAPANEIRKTSRRYRGDTLVLETEFETAEGVVALIDFMPVRDHSLSVVRIVEGKRGTVPMTMELVIRFDYGSIMPWVRRAKEGIVAVAGPDMLRFHTPVEVSGRDFTTVAEFSAAAGQQVPFSLTWHASHQKAPPPRHAARDLTETIAWWENWSGTCRYSGPYREAVMRSLITLKALTYAPTGGIVAAPTTSLPEFVGGVRNWDYRICWLRDATFTLYSLLTAGYQSEAAAWREWLHRAVAGDPATAQIMYGVAGERRLTEWEVPWLPGYENSHPVRIGNAAHQQFQLDVYGEIADAMYQSRRSGMKEADEGWPLEMALLGHLIKVWEEPDEGIWEVRGPRQHFTHSKVMAWVAVDRAIKSVECCGLRGPIEEWCELRERIHAEVCAKGFDPHLNSFVQSFGSKLLDASVLMIPLVGFLPPDDPRVLGTVAAIEKGLMRDGFVARYDSAATADGLPAGEGAFLACTFWLADNLVLMNRHDDAQRIFERLLALRNDVGLLSEEYDPKSERLVGNFPQAFSHVGLVNTAMNLARLANCPAEHRRRAGTM